VIKALLFDFDGTLVDTESVEFRAWEQTFLAHDVKLVLERYGVGVGTLEGFDPLTELESLLGHEIDREGVNEGRRALEFELLASEVLRPGVHEYLEAARELGLRVAIVSSASDDWIEGNLARLERSHGWECIVAANGDVSRAKPAPTLYLEALERLGVAAHEAVAFEDSSNGARAAHAAGIFCVAVPNPITAHLDVQGDLNLGSFQELPLAHLLELVRERTAA
jgi:haloacid dehalogenase superfamily, subfamily IA, variant 3 with third motif having DD or ED